jgi:hypothetical protein
MPANRIIKGIRPERADIPPVFHRPLTPVQRFIQSASAHADFGGLQRWEVVGLELSDPGIVLFPIGAQTRYVALAAQFSQPPSLSPSKRRHC